MGGVLYAYRSIDKQGQCLPGIFPKHDLCFFYVLFSKIRLPKFQRLRKSGPHRIMAHSELFQQTIDRFIELYGDRTGGHGDAIRGGLAWIQDTKVILLAEGSKLQHPSSWRRLSRLLSLAQQLRRPVLLWHQPFQIATTASQRNSLVINNTIQNSKLQLLQLPLPIVSVFDEPSWVPLEYELAMVDGAVLVQSQPQANSMSDNLPFILKISNCPSTLKSKILELLNQISAIPVETLVHHRMNRVRKIVDLSD